MKIVPSKKTWLCRCRSSLALLATGLPMLFLSAEAQLSPAARDLFRSTVGTRIETATILGGDYGVGGGAYNASKNNENNVDLSITKFGGTGVIGDPRQLGTLDIGWQPLVQGSMGYLTAKDNFDNLINGGDTSKTTTFAIQFGGGARFWFNDSFSVAPTFMGMYGHSENDYHAVSPFGLRNQAEASREGLINWSADTWTIRPSMNFQYQFFWKRTILTLSSEPTYFHTESFSSSGSSVDVNGDSETWENKVDVDVPLGVQLWGHELRTGGYFARTELFGTLQNGVNSDYLYDAHARIVLDTLNQVWKMQWIGLGLSHYWGEGFDGWAIGMDVTFRF